MTETSTRARKPASDLSAMLLPELRKVGVQLGIDGAIKMPKAALVTAISDLQAANRAASAKPARKERPADKESSTEKSDSSSNSNNGNDGSGDAREDNRDSRSDRSDRDNVNNRNDRDNRSDRNDRDNRNDRGRDRHRDRDRNRDRHRPPREEREAVISEGDVLVPVGGLVDILDNFSFIRTSGYLPSPNDVYVSMQQVRKYGLRKGDVVTGAVREPREGERREKFNALLRLDTINGMEPDEAKDRIEFNKLVPLYPQDRLRLETEPNILTTRVIDLIAPIGKGQRGLIVSPPKAGKTMVLQAIANAITKITLKFT